MLLAPRRPPAPRRPGFADILAPHTLLLGARPPASPQRGLAGELAPLLLPGGIGVQCEDQRTHLRTQSHRQPTPKIATTRGTPAASSASASKHLRIPTAVRRSACSAVASSPSRRGDGHAAWPWAPALPQSHRTAVQVHQATIWCGMRKDHAAPAPVAGRMRPGARPRIAHAMLLRQRQRNAPLLQVGGAAAAGGLKRSKLVSEVWPPARGCGAAEVGGGLVLLATWRAVVAGDAGGALPVSRRASKGRLALLLLAPPPAPFPCSPRHHRQSTQNGRYTPARAGCAGGRSRGRAEAAARGRLRRRWDGRQLGRPRSASDFLTGRVRGHTHGLASWCIVPDQGGKSTRFSPYRRGGSSRQ